jgi:hypothetical protein
MKISSSIADIQSTYGSEKTSQTSSKKAFIIPNLDEVAKTDNAQKPSYDPFKAAKTGSVNLPEWMQTKTTPTRSDAEILKEIEALAKEHAMTGQFQDGDPRFKALMDEYVSSVSPDRESILKNSITEINERIAMEMSGMARTASEDPMEKAKKKDGELIDYLIKAIDAKNGKNNIIATRSDGYYTAIDFNRGGGNVTTLVYDSQGNKMPWMTMKGNMYDMVSVQNGVVTSAFFYDSNGQVIMTYSNGNDNKDGLAQIQTNAEHTRYKEMQAVYNAVYDFSIGRYNPHEQPNIITKVLTNVNGIVDTPALVKGVYDSTYERLRSENFA